MKMPELAKAAARRRTWSAQLREARSLAITAAVWPFGWADRGVAELRSLAGAESSPQRTPVLLVHGYGANKSNWIFLDRELRSVGYERVHALNYNPLRSSLPELADRCVKRARDLMEHFGVERIHLVGHSLGGLIARYAVCLGGLENVGVCVTVASPHQGVPLAALDPGTAARDIRPGSPVMRRLHASARHMPTRFIAYYSNVDLLVPGWRAMIRQPALRATNVLVKDEGHLSILLSRRLAESVATQLAAADGVHGYGSLAAPLTASPASPSRTPLWMTEGGIHGEFTGLVP